MADDRGQPCPFCDREPAELPYHLREDCDELPELDTERVY